MFADLNFLFQFQPDQCCILLDVQNENQAANLKIAVHKCLQLLSMFQYPKK